MESALVAGVGVENCEFRFDKLFSFSVPKELEGSVVPGRRVLVPFGRGSRLRQGFVFTVSAQPETLPDVPLKPVFSAADEPVLLDETMLKLAAALKEQTFSTYFACAKAMLPGGMCVMTQRLYEAAGSGGDVRVLSPAQRAIFDFLLGREKPEPESALFARFGSDTTGSDLRLLEKNGFVRVEPPRQRLLPEKEERLYYMTGEAETGGRKTPAQNAVLSFLEQAGSASGKEICYFTGVSDSVIARLVKSGRIAWMKRHVERAPETAYAGKRDVLAPLSAPQRQVYEQITQEMRSGRRDTALLYGVTGSGKTNVYLELIDFVLKQGRTAIVLVPEISLTPQTVSVLLDRFGDSVALMHSSLSVGERRDAFFRIRSGQARIVAGTRSAVFAPLRDLGLIVVDEEQEHTYKSDMSPRYDARSVARMRAKAEGAFVLLASATPSVESYARAEKGAYLLCSLPTRFGGAVLPDVIKADMGDRANANPFSALSVPLQQELEENLSRGEQSILLVNRRGYHTFVVCKACKTVVTCPYCSVSMTYHAANGRLMCHMCGYSMPYAQRCPVCGDENLRYSGCGTQRMEQELKTRYPEARVLRMDADTTMVKNAHRDALSAFAAGEYDILVGTQMVAKGLDFPNVSLVGVVSADNELYSGDFRGAEKTFSLITQVIGRAGRGAKKGRAVIQTMTPDNRILELAAGQDYVAFYRQEISMRQALICPPFCDICLVSFSAPEKELAERASLLFFKALRDRSQREYPDQRLILLGPMPHRVPKINSQYREKLLIKCRGNAPTRSMIGETLKETASLKETRGVRIYAAMNPDRTD